VAVSGCSGLSDLLCCDVASVYSTLVSVGGVFPRLNIGCVDEGDVDVAITPISGSLDVAGASTLVTADGPTGVGVVSDLGARSAIDAENEGFSIAFSERVAIKNLRLAGFNRRAVASDTGRISFNQVHVRCGAFNGANELTDIAGLRSITISGDLLGASNDIDLSEFGVVNRCELFFNGRFGAPGFALSSVSWLELDDE
jgi:hypothetical protein